MGSPSGSARFSVKHLQTIVVIVAIFLAAFVQIASKIPTGGEAKYDFDIYYLSGLALREGRNPYSENFGGVMQGRRFNVGYVHHATDPPSFLMFFELFSLLPLRMAYMVWMALNFVILGASCFLLLPNDSRLSISDRWTLAGLALLYYPVAEHFEYGQSKLLILFLLVLMIDCLGRQRERSAGLLLAVAGLFRIYPLLLVLYLAIYRKWRCISFAAVGVSIGAIMTVLTIGLRNSLAFVSGLDLLSARYVAMEQINISLYAVCSRVFWGLFGTTSGSIDIARLAIVGICELLVLLTTIYVTRPGSRFEDPQWSGVSLWIASMLLLSPVSWTFNMVLLLIPFAQIAKAFASQEISSRSIYLMVSSYALITLAFVLVYIFRNWPPGMLHRMTLTIFGELRFVSMAIAWLAACCFANEMRLQEISRHPEQMDSLRLPRTLPSS